MEAKKPHNMPSASRSPRKAGDIIQSKFKSLRIREADDGVSLSPREGKEQCSGTSNSEFSLYLLFSSGP